MDALEKYIYDHREELRKPEEDAKVPKGIWQGVEERLEEEELAEALERATPQPVLPESVWSKIEALLEEGDEELTSTTVRKSRQGAATPTASSQSGKMPAQEKMVPMRRMWQMAAVFALILVATVYMQSYWQGAGTSAEQVADAAEERQISDMSKGINTELQQAESYYRAVIQKKKESLKKYDLKQYGINPKEFDRTLKQLDKDYQLLKDDFQQSQQHGQVLQTMIQNLQLRMELLNQQLQLLEKLQEKEQVAEYGA